jgi:hypothetical protein
VVPALSLCRSEERLRVSSNEVPVCATIMKNDKLVKILLKSWFETFPILHRNSPRTANGKTQKI